MSELSALALLPFIPSGKRLRCQSSPFRYLGFEEVWENDGYAGFRNGDAQFILQKFDVKEFAENFMVRLNVKDHDTCIRRNAGFRRCSARSARLGKMLRGCGHLKRNRRARASGKSRATSAPEGLATRRQLKGRTLCDGYGMWSP